MTPLTLPSLIAAAVVPPAAREMPITALEPNQPATTGSATGSPTSFGQQFKQARQRGSVKETSQSPAATSNKPATPHNGEAPAHRSNWTPTTGKAGMATGKAAQGHSAAPKTPAEQQKLHTAAAPGKDSLPAASEAGILAASQTAEAGLGTSVAAVPEALPEALIQTTGLPAAAADATEMLVATSDIVPTVPGEEAATPPTDPTTDVEVEVSGGCAMPDPADAAVFVGVLKTFVAQPLPGVGGQLTALAQAAMAQLEAALKSATNQAGAEKPTDPLAAAHAGGHGKDMHGAGDARNLKAGAKRAEAAEEVAALAAAETAKGVLAEGTDDTTGSDGLPGEEKDDARPDPKDLAPTSPNPNALAAQPAAAAAPQPLVVADKPTQAAAAEAQASLEVGAASATVPGSVIAGASPAATDAAKAPQKAATPTATASKTEDAEPADAQTELPAASTAAAAGAGPATAIPLRASARPEALSAAQTQSAPPKATALPIAAEKETVSATGPAAERPATASPVEFAQVAPAVMAAAAPQERSQVLEARPADTAAAVMSATIDPPIQSAAFAPALGARIAVMARDGVEEARLNVHPADMGPITVQLVLDGSLVRVDMSAEMASTRQTLEQALPSLAASLREAGFTLSGGGVSQQANPNNGQPGAQGDSGGFRAPERAISGDGLELNGTTAARGAVGRETGLVDLYA